ncbi:mas-related G-protein coupled receptor member X2-like [Nannospalax galili]|uniref:mas-related G-protein coupled receptor member X2-like n=1 Tax=Nannospalax galili TaxID=1026970 RepID=UPI0004ED4A55|nr:mas-related G-protein coupled receptor member X2-like [Nannospalax galili]
MNRNISTWATENTTMNGNDIPPTPCDIMNLTLDFLILIFAVVGLAVHIVYSLKRIIDSFYSISNSKPIPVFILIVFIFAYLVGLSMLSAISAECVHIVYSLKSIIDSFYPVSNSESIPVFVFLGLIFAYLVSLSMLSAISAERCLSVLWPIWYRCRRPRHASAVICALLWALSLLLSILEGKGCGFLLPSFDYDWCRAFDFITAAWVIALFVVLSGSSLVLLVRIFYRPHRMPVTRLYVTIALTVLVFLLLGLPFGIEWFLLAWIEDFYFSLPCHLYGLTKFLSSVNSCVNPIIYFFVGSIRQRRFQGRRPRTLKLILQRAMQDIPEEEEGETGSSEKPGEVETV